MAGFDKYSNYSKDTSFSSVTFGSNKPVLEVELNEVQQIVNTKIGNILKLIGAKVLFLVKPTYNASQKIFTLNSTIVAVGDYVIEIDTAKVTYSATNKEIYLKLEEIDVDHTTELHAYGNTGGVVIANNIKDPRMPGETTRRKCIAFTLEAGPTVPTSTDTVKYISVATSASGGSVTFTDYLNQRKNGAVLNSKSIMAELSEIVKALDDISDGTRAVANANKLGGNSPNYYAVAEDFAYKIMSQEELDTKVSATTTVKGLIDQIPNQCVLYAYTNTAVAWYPAGITPSGCVLTVTRFDTKDSAVRVSLHLTNVTDCTQTYVAGYNGTTFTGWYSLTANIISPASVVEE